MDPQVVARPLVRPFSVLQNTGYDEAIAKELGDDQSTCCQSPNSVWSRPPPARVAST